VSFVTSRGCPWFGPQLTPFNDSGSGNGPFFGFGWSLSVPAIARKTDMGLPQYDYVGESDVNILSVAADLVPVLGGDGRRSPPDDTTGLGGSAGGPS
jgi:hypothetical protein